MPNSRAVPKKVAARKRSLTAGRRVHWPARTISCAFAPSNTIFRPKATNAVCPTDQRTVSWTGALDDKRTVPAICTLSPGSTAGVLWLPGGTLGSGRTGPTSLYALAHFATVPQKSGVRCICAGSRGALDSPGSGTSAHPIGGRGKLRRADKAPILINHATRL